MAQNDRRTPKEKWWQFAASARTPRGDRGARPRAGDVSAQRHTWRSLFSAAERSLLDTLASSPSTPTPRSAPSNPAHTRSGRASSVVDEGRSPLHPSDCFETFPFPENWETDPALEAAGKAYYEFRAALMVRNNEGLTKTYNRFHDPDERDPDIVKLRELHAAMDRAVLDAYGWSDIPTDCEFLLDYEIDEEEWGNKKKPYRYRWPDEVRDEVLARLLELNAERAKEEARSAPLRQRGGKKRPRSRASATGHGGPFS